MLPKSDGPTPAEDAETDLPLPPSSDKTDDERDDPADYTDLLRAFEDAEDHDDEEARELEAGVDLSETDEDDSPDGDADLEIGDVVDEEEPDAAPPGDRDDVGPDDIEVDLDIDDAEDGAGDDAEGAGEPLGDLITEDLPALEARVDDEDVLDLMRELPPLPEDDAPPQSELPWVEVPLAGHTGPRPILARVGPRIVAAGRVVTLLDESGVGTALTEDLGRAVTSVAGTADLDAFLCATSSGDLFRVDRKTGAAEPVSAWRTAAEPLPADPELRVGGPTPSSLPALLLHVKGPDVLLESTDHGTTFRRIDLGGRVVALSAGTPPLCLVESERGLRVLRSAPSGGFAAVSSTWPADPDVAQIAVDGEIVAVLDPSRAVYVSADGGLAFQGATGASRATAITVGRLGGRPSAFTALFEEASGRAPLVWIDAASGDALIIAYVEPEDEDDDDAARVTSLAWDPAAETLWVGTGFGLRAFRRPPSA